MSGFPPRCRSRTRKGPWWGRWRRLVGQLCSGVGRTSGVLTAKTRGPQAARARAPRAMGCFHSDASAFTAIPHFASVITLAKCGIPLKTQLRLQDCSRCPRGGRGFPLKTRHRLQSGPPRLASNLRERLKREYRASAAAPPAPRTPRRPRRRGPLPPTPSWGRWAPRATTTRALRSSSAFPGRRAWRAASGPSCSARGPGKGRRSA